MPTIKIRPNMPNFDDLYTGVTDDAFSRIQASTRVLSAQAKAMGVGAGASDTPAFEDNYDYDADDDNPGGGYEFASEDEQKLASILSHEDPEAELHAGSNSFYLYPEYGAIMGVNRHNGSVFVNTYDYEDELEEAWEEAAKSTRRREL